MIMASGFPSVLMQRTVYPPQQDDQLPSRFRKAPRQPWRYRSSLWASEIVLGDSVEPGRAYGHQIGTGAV